MNLFNQLLSSTASLSGLKEENSNSDGSRGKVNLSSWDTALGRARGPVDVGTPRQAREGLGLCEREEKLQGRRQA